MKPLLLLPFIFLLVFFSSFQCYSQINPYSDLPVDSAFKTGKLSNGLSYYILKNGKPENQVELRLVVKAGSVLEDENQLGLAHFMEHMSFAGTKHFPKNQLIDYLQSIGVKFGADLNASTSFDETIYRLPVSSDKPEILEKAFTVLEDWAFNNSFDPEMINKERGVVLEESRFRRTPALHMNTIYLKKMLEGTPYANRIPIGKDSIIINFKPDVLEQFYRKWYRPDLMAVIAVGDIDPVEIEKKIKSHFESYRNPEHEAPYPAPTAIQERKMPNAIIETDPDIGAATLDIFYYTRTRPKQLTWVDFREQLDERIIISIINGRLEAVSRMATPPYVSASLGIQPLVRGQEVLHSYMKLGPRHLSDAINEEVSVIENVRKNGFATSDLDRFKISYNNHNEQYYNDRSNIPSGQLVTQFISNFLHDTPLVGIDNEHAFIKQWLPAINVDEINGIAAKILLAPNFLSVIKAPESMGRELPTGQRLIADIADASNFAARNFRQDPVLQRLAFKQPKSGHILNEVSNEKLGTIDFTLNNGITVTIKPTHFKNDEILMDGWRLGGVHRFPVEEKDDAENCAVMIRQMGIGDYSGNDIARFELGKNVKVTPYINQDEEGIQGNCGVNDLETLFQLTYQYMTNPRKDPDLFETINKKNKGQADFIMKNPLAYFADTINRVIFPNNSWAPQTRNERYYNRLSLHREFSIYNELYKNAFGMHFTFTGNIDTAGIKPLIEMYIASLPASQIVNKSQDIGLRPVRGIVKAVVKKGKENKSVIRLVFTGEATYSKQEELAFKGLIEVLNIQVIEKLRLQMSQIYSGGFSGDIRRRPYLNYMLSANIPCGPENVDKITAALIELIESDRQNGIDKNMLDKVKENWRKQNRANLLSNTYWHQTLTNAWINNDNPEDILTNDKLIDQLSIDDVKRSAVKYLDLKNYITLVLDPENI